MAAIISRAKAAAAGNRRIRKLWLKWHRREAAAGWRKWLSSKRKAQLKRQRNNVAESVKARLAFVA
jgi:hypothetical protein